MVRQAAHDRVPVDRADEPPLLPVVRAPMLVVDDARLEREPLPQLLDLQDAIEVNPLAAIPRPGRAAEQDGPPLPQELLLDRPQVLADHRVRRPSQTPGGRRRRPPRGGRTAPRPIAAPTAGSRPLSGRRKGRRRSAKPLSPARERRTARSKT